MEKIRDTQHLMGCLMKDEIQNVPSSFAVLGSHGEKERTGEKVVEFTRAKQAPEEAMFKHWKTMSALRQNTGEIPQMFLSRNSLNTNGRLSLLSSSILAKIFNFWVFKLSGLLVSGV